jgi:hypothetical protein
MLPPGPSRSVPAGPSIGSGFVTQRCRGACAPFSRLVLRCRSRLRRASIPRAMLYRRGADGCGPGAPPVSPTPAYCIRRENTGCSPCCCVVRWPFFSRDSEDTSVKERSTANTSLDEAHAGVDRSAKWSGCGADATVTPCGNETAARSKTNPGVSDLMYLNISLTILTMPSH